MLQVVIMPMESYNMLIGHCGVSCPEYELLRNAFVMRSGQSDGTVCVPSDTDSARMIVDFAAAHCPELVPHIKTVKDEELWPVNAKNLVEE